MPLILTSQIRSVLEPKEGFLTHYLLIPKKIFSETYLIPDGTEISGSVENIGMWESFDDFSISYENVDFSSILSELEGKKLEFFYRKIGVGNYDWLYFYSESWDILRGYGIIAGYNFIRIRIEAVFLKDDKQETKYIQIFPNRDVKIVIN